MPSSPDFIALSYHFPAYFARGSTTLFILLYMPISLPYHISLSASFDSFMKFSFMSCTLSCRLRRIFTFKPTVQLVHDISGVICLVAFPGYSIIPYNISSICVRNMYNPLDSCLNLGRAVLIDIIPPNGSQQIALCPHLISSELNLDGKRSNSMLVVNFQSCLVGEFLQYLSSFSPCDGIAF